MKDEHLRLAWYKMCYWSCYFLLFISTFLVISPVTTLSYSPQENSMDFQSTISINEPLNDTDTKCNNTTTGFLFGDDAFRSEFFTPAGAHRLDDTITIGFLTPYNQNPFSLGAMTLAVERVNNDSNLLPGRTLKFIAANIQGSELELASLPIRIMTDMRDKGIIAFIGGPEDMCVSEALVSAAWNLPLISYKCSDYQVSDKKTYSTFARTLPPSSKVSKSVVALLKKFSWDQIVIIVAQRRKDRWHKNIEAFKEIGTVGKPSEGILGVFILSKKNGINVTATFILHDYIPDKFSEMEKIVTESFEKTRVYVFMGEHEALVDLVRGLDNRKLLDNGEYIIISVDDKICAPKTQCNYIQTDLFDGYPDPDFENESYFLSNDTISRNNSTINEMTLRRVHAFRSVLKIQSSYPKMQSEIFTLFANYSAGDPFCLPYHPIFADVKVPIEAAYLYDAVMIYARALTEHLEANQDPRNGTQIFEKIRNRSYHSIQGFDVFIDKNGDAEGNYTVLALLPDETLSLKSMQPVGYFRQEISTDSNMNIKSDLNALEEEEAPATVTTFEFVPVFQYFDATKQIQWIGRKPPRSAPACGFRGEFCVYKPDWRTIIICSIFGSVISIAAILVARHYRYEQKLACLLWKIDMRDVIMIPMGPAETLNGTKSTVTLCRQLLSGTAADHEIPHELPYKKAYTRIGFYKGMVVAVKPIYKKSIDLTRNIRKELKQIREFRHENIIPFIGASVEHGNINVLTAYSARGSLEDVLQNDDLHLDNMFLASLVADLIKGMIYLHDSEIVSHGNLKSSNCLVDSRWVLQISDFGLNEFKASQDVRDVEKLLKGLLWKAPELLRDHNPAPRGTQKGDVYSFGIILYELIGRSGPWGKTKLTTSEIISRVSNPEFNNGQYLRPPAVHLDCGETILNCLHSCWEEDPDIRPDFRFIRIRLKEMQAGLKPNIFDNMLSIMEKYACNLEDLVQERTIQLMEEKKKTDALLHRMLPRSVADSLKRGEPVQAETFDSVSIYFSDIVGFTELSAISTPLQVVELLNDLYTCFDSIISNYDVYKVETIGDAYMVVSGLPLRNGNQHAGEIASMALHLLDRIQSFEIKHRSNERLKLRIGIHTGPVVAGVVGLKMPRYCLFGDTVNTASRMESSGEALRIHISDVTKNVLETLGGYYYEERGIIPIKGKGMQKTWWVTGEDPSKTRRNSTESGDLAMMNNNCTNISSVKLDKNEANEEDDSYPELLAGNGGHVNGYKPTTWLLSECSNGKIVGGPKNGRYVSCSNVFHECKANIMKEFKRNGQPSGNNFRSVPIITFMETNNSTNRQPYAYEESNFV